MSSSQLSRHAGLRDRSCLKINERRRDKAKTGEKAQCTRQYMSILSSFSTQYRQARQGLSKLASAGETRRKRVKKRSVHAST
jgi:hypothetical protein